MVEETHKSNLKQAINRLAEAHEAALTESILFTRPLLTSSKNNLITTLMSLLSQLIDYRAGCAWIVDGTTLYDSQSFGDTERHQPEFDRHFRDGLAGWVSESRKLHVVPAPQGCFVLIPVVSKTNNYALIDLALNVNVDQLTKPATELMETLAAHTAMALEQHHLESWQQRIKRFLELLPERSNITDPTRLLETVINDIRSLLEVDNCSVMLLDQRTQSLKVAAAAGLPEEFRNTTVPIGSGLSGQVAQSGRPLFVEDSRHESRFDFPWRDNYDGRSIISLPLTYREQILGVLNVTNRHSHRRLYRSDAALLELFASHVALAWQQAVLIEQLKLESTEWRGIFDIIDEAVFVLNTQERVVQANKKTNALFGRLGSLVIGKRLGELIPSIGDELHRIFNILSPVQSAKYDLPVVIDEISMTLSLKPVIQDGGSITGYVGLVSPQHPELAAASFVKADNDHGSLKELFEAILHCVSLAKTGPANSLFSELERITIYAQAGLNSFGKPEAPTPPRFVPAALETKPKLTIVEERKRILVVDDEVEMRDLLKDILDLAGYEIIAVSTGPEAVVQLDKKDFDLVITDLGMPLLNGWEVARAVKLRQPNTPVIMVSGWGPEIEQQGHELGVDLVLPKPFQVDSVVESVAKTLKQSQKKTSTMEP